MAASEPAPTTTPPVRWARVLGVGLTLLLVLELVAQGFVFAWTGRRFESFAKFRLSPYGLVRNNPELTLPGFSHNANGFRNDRDFQREKPPNTLRVFYLGGSTAYGGLSSVMIRGAERPNNHGVLNHFLEQRLRADPELAGLEIEVINAAIPFNRGFELGTQYMTEYAAWEPDVVIVAGTSNNYPPRQPRVTDLERHHYGMTATHPWAEDFERIANSRGPLSLVERGMLVAEEQLASAAIFRKGASKVVDLATTRAQAVRLWSPPTPAVRDATLEEFDAYVREVNGMYDAMLSVARAHDQEMVFFWEYYVHHLRDVRPYGELEAEFVVRLNRPGDDGRYNFRARDALAELARARGSRLLDPIDVMKNDRTTIFIDYLHYTPDGNRVLADFVYEELKETFRERGRRARERSRALVARPPSSPPE